MGLTSGARRFVTAACVATALLATAPDARAWYFPEHVLITHDGLAEVPPEIREVLGAAVARARAEGLAICPRVDVSLEEVTRPKPLQTRMIRSAVSVDCVPYSALPALAGDHASSAGELRRVLASEKGIEITTAVAYEWSRFREALDQLPKTPLERMSFVHDLDVAFYFIDPGYELRAQATRAHFVDAGRSLDEVLREAAEASAVDNSLGQFLAHHMRSIELAARGQAPEAILEHAFAMHFMQDAFAAGHLVMTDAIWTHGNTYARSRHDFFDSKGLAVGHAMSVESCASLATWALAGGLSPCWVTSGDGHLGITPDASDRIHAARAVAKAELQFALALDPARVVAAVEASGEREQLAIEELVDPVPWWTVRAAGGKTRCPSASRALRLVRGGAAAVQRLRPAMLTPAVEVGTPPRVALFEPELLLGALKPCKIQSEADSDDSDEAVCGAGHTLDLGAVGPSLLRPVLAEWPAAQADVGALGGQARTDHGLAVQLLASVSAGALFPDRAPADFFAPAIGVAAGVSYRWGTYLPGRLDRAVAELNVGISDALHYDSDGHPGGNWHITMLDQELRWPIAFEILTSYLLPLDLRAGHDAGRMVFLSGARVHEIIGNPKPILWGVELEVAALALSRGKGAYPLYAASPELRFYLGMADPSAAQPGFPTRWAPTIGLTLTGGYATFL